MLEGCLSFSNYHRAFYYLLTLSLEIITFKHLLTEDLPTLLLRVWGQVNHIHSHYKSPGKRHVLCAQHRSASKTSVQNLNIINYVEHKSA